MITKTIVILANSIKHGKHCVAGKCVETKKWIRPVSSIGGAELNQKQSTFHNLHGGGIVKPMQKIEMYFQSSVPLINQPENHLINKQPWQEKYKISEDQLPIYLDNPADIWGQDDRVDYEEIVQKNIVISQSLYLIQVHNLVLFKNGSNKRRANFLYNDVKYDLAVTDPNFDKLKSEGNAMREILCISLGEEFHGACFKLVATIF